MSTPWHAAARRFVLTMLFATTLSVPLGVQPVAAGESVPPIEVISVRLWVKGTTVWGVGVLRNTSSRWIYPMVNVAWSDACGTGAMNGTPLSVPLAPGARATFLSAAARDCAPGTPTVTEASAWGLVNPASTGAIGIRRQPNQLVPNTETGQIAALGGIIHNPLPFAVDVMTVGVTFYDAAGVAVSAAWLPFDTTVGPDQQLSAELSGQLRPGIVRATLSVSARRTSDPHAPITTFDNYFLDSFSSPFINDITWLAGQEITGGCGTYKFCPSQAVTRGQMAAFLSRALALPATSTDFFTDDGSSIFEGDINRLAASGITGGCGGDRFCPSATVTRGQMAAFLSRALALPATSTDFFTDDGSSIFEGDINRLAASGITGGCTSDRFCPTSAVTRAQIAAFLHRGLD